MSCWKELERRERADIVSRLENPTDGQPRVSFREFCNLLVYNGLTHVRGYFHYTTWGRLGKILKRTKVESGEERILFCLSSTADLNDTAENSVEAYVASFSFGEEEEVAMWTNYGVPKPEAIRIRFPKSAITAWVRENPPEKIKVYKGKPSGDFVLLEQEEVLDARFVDVAYYGRNRTNEKESISDGVIYKGNRCSFREKKWRGALLESCPEAALLFKKRGWAYEREVRLVVRLKHPLPPKMKIALDFTSLFEAVLADQANCLMVGPWFDPRNFPLSDIACIDLNKVAKSCFMGELNMRSNCDACKGRTKTNCRCPYRPKDI